MKNIDFSEFKIGKKQQTGIMSVYPLLANDVDTELATFEDVKFNGTSTYGTMVFENKGDKPFIIPTGYTIMTPQKAQDHALPFASLLDIKSIRGISTACCVESTQCGEIDGSKVTGFNLLPLYIRKKHFQSILKQNKDHSIGTEPQDLSFTRLWDHISSFQKDLLKKQDSHLIYFFDNYMDKLLHFNAEFECVENQRGAIILLNDKVIGIEIAPTQAYWKIIWNSLIRDCYGSEVLRQTMLNLVGEFKKQNLIDLSTCKTIEQITNTIDQFFVTEATHANDILKEVSNNQYVEVSRENCIVTENSLGDITYHLFKQDGYDTYGELYQDGNKMIYCSLLF